MTPISRTTILLGWAIVLGAATGPGVVQPTFTTAEIGTVIGEVDVTVVGSRLTIAAITDGYLYTGASYVTGADSQDNWQHSWWDISNPRQPRLVDQKRMLGDKPHSIGFLDAGRWGVVRTNGWWTSILDFHDRNTFTSAPTLPGEAKARYSMWSAFQGHYLYRTVSGYTTDAPMLEVYDMRDPTTWNHLADIDMAQLVGFKVASVHPFGNLMICSGAETSGVATLDISDPTVPQVIDIDHSGVSEKVYISVLRDQRLFTASNSSDGIEAYDIAADGSISYVGLVELRNRAGDLQPAMTQKYVTYYEDQLWTCWNGATINMADVHSLENLATYDEGPGFGIPNIDDIHGGGQGPDFILPLGNMIVEVWDGIKIRAIAEQPDHQGPRVLSHNPVDGSTHIPLTSRFGMTMSEPILPESLDADAVILRPVGGDPIAIRSSIQLPTLVGIAPLEALQPETVYELILPAGGIEDLVGNAMAQDWTATFSTGASTGSNADPVIGEIAAEPDPVTGTTTRLSVTASDVDGDELDFLWSVSTAPAGSDPTIGTGDGPLVTFDRAGSYRFQVIVTDGAGGRATGHLDIDVVQQAANIGLVP